MFAAEAGKLNARTVAAAIKMRDEMVIISLPLFFDVCRK
jgi:hypothetical protein